MAGWGNIALITLLILAVGAILSAVWWWVPKRQMRGLTFENDKDRAATEDNFRKTVGQVIGGAAVLVGALLAYLQFSQHRMRHPSNLQNNRMPQPKKPYGSRPPRMSSSKSSRTRHQSNRRRLPNSSPHSRRLQGTA